MKKILILVLVIAISNLSLTSCSSDDDSGGSTYPQTVNIKYEITTTRNSAAIVNRTIDNTTQTDDVGNLPYSFIYAQQVVNEGTFLKMTYVDNGIYTVDESGSSWTDYSAELKITIGTNVVKTQTFTITEASGAVQIDYTFE